MSVERDEETDLHEVVVDLDLTNVISKFDQDRSGSIEFPEFVDMVYTKSIAKDVEDVFKLEEYEIGAMERFMRKDELAELLQQVDEKLSPADIDSMIRESSIVRTSKLKIEHIDFARFASLILDD